MAFRALKTPISFPYFSLELSLSTESCKTRIRHHCAKTWTSRIPVLGLSFRVLGFGVSSSQSSKSLSNCSLSDHSPIPYPSLITSVWSWPDVTRHSWIHTCGIMLKPYAGLWLQAGGLVSGLLPLAGAASLLQDHSLYRCSREGAQGSLARSMPPASFPLGLLCLVDRIRGAQGDLGLLLSLKA